jgi:hypothetical protein
MCRGTAPRRGPNFDIVIFMYEIFMIYDYQGLWAFVSANASYLQHLINSAVVISQKRPRNGSNPNLG